MPTDEFTAKLLSKTRSKRTVSELTAHSDNMVAFSITGTTAKTSAYTCQATRPWDVLSVFPVQMTSYCLRLLPVEPNLLRVKPTRTRSRR